MAFPKKVLRATAVICCGVIFSLSALGQTVIISPANPVVGDTITATFSAPDSCNLNIPVPLPPPPLPFGIPYNFFVYQSISNVGVTCPAPPPIPFVYSTSSAPLGTLPAGTYTVEWQDFVGGLKVFDVTTQFTVSPVPASAAPMLSTDMTLSLIIAILGIGYLRFHRRLH